MAILKRTETSSDYKELMLQAKSTDEDKFCAPMAIAIVTGRSFQEVVDVMNDLGRKPRSGTPQSICNSTLDALGFKRIRVNAREIIGKFPKPHCNVLKGLTTHHPRRFPGSFDQNKMYLAHVRGHVLAIAGGQVHDWSINNSLRIYLLEEIVPK